jgi:hypothetical protein
LARVGEGVEDDIGANYGDNRFQRISL